MTVPKPPLQAQAVSFCSLLLVCNTGAGFPGNVWLKQRFDCKKKMDISSLFKHLCVEQFLLQLKRKASEFACSIEHRGISSFKLLELGLCRHD